MIGSVTLSELAQELNGELIGEDVTFANVCTDTRLLESGDLYLALVGDNFDGNNFVKIAESSGACAAVVSRELDSNIATLRVDDTKLALGTIARTVRQRSSAKVVALTGSQGKTTVKEMLRSILGCAGDCLATEANLNNTIGVPLTLLKIEERHEYVVIEMGADCAGEIAFSVNATEPDIALITNASPAHIEGFGSLMGIVEAKGEIIDGLKSDGVMLLNADDPHVQAWAARAAGKTLLRFSYENAAGDSQYYASQVTERSDGTSQFVLHTPQGEQALSSRFLGKHNVLNAVAASAVAMEAGASLEHVMGGLANLEPVAGRLSRLAGVNGCKLIDDSYNASPSSFFAAIDVLTSLPGRKLLVMGDMRELGVDSADAHSSVGEYASASSIDDLWAIGDESRLAVAACPDKGRHFADKQALIAEIESIAGPDMTVLIKGSRGSKMNEIVDALKYNGETQC